VNDFKLMKRAPYAKLGNPLAMTPDLKVVPHEVYEARNAVDIGESRGADRIRMRQRSLPRPRPAEVIGVEKDRQVTSVLPRTLLAAKPPSELSTCRCVLTC
jgi:hypothetical protein